MPRKALTASRFLWLNVATVGLMPSCEGQAQKGAPAASEAAPAPVTPPGTTSESSPTEERRGRSADIAEFAEWAVGGGLTQPAASFPEGESCLAFSADVTIPRPSYCCQEDYCSGTFQAPQGWMANVVWLEGMPSAVSTVLSVDADVPLTCKMLHGTQVGGSWLHERDGRTFRLCRLPGAYGFMQQSEHGVSIMLESPAMLREDPVSAKRLAGYKVKASASDSARDEVSEAGSGR